MALHTFKGSGTHFSDYEHVIVAVPAFLEHSLIVIYFSGSGRVFHLRQRYVAYASGVRGSLELPVTKVIAETRTINMQQSTCSKPDAEGMGATTSWRMLHQYWQCVCLCCWFNQCCYDEWQQGIAQVLVAIFPAN
jgi:hypothetical protein